MNKAAPLPTLCALLLAASMALAGCSRFHGEPGPGPEVPRPERVLDFPTLYKNNCAGCHGENGKNGAAIALANPVYIAIAGEARLKTLIGSGVKGSLMPGFAQSAGGMLTDQQVNALAAGMVRAWANPAAPGGQTPPPYQSTLAAHADQGRLAFATFCARCHGTVGEGGPADGNPAGKSARLGSIVDPAYLAIVSDQGLRSIVIAGRPDQGMPDWRSDAAQPITDQQLTDILAWIASRRTPDTGPPSAPQH